MPRNFQTRWEGLTYQQGDSFDFFGIAGRPGMARSQLAQAVITALNVEGKYTVEVTGSGTANLNDATVYENLYQDENYTSKQISTAGNGGKKDKEDEESTIMIMHTQASEEL